MGLSVGVVSIEYLDQPDGPVDDFLRALLVDPDCGIDEEDDEGWGGGWANNSLYEYERDGLTRQAANWCNAAGVDAAGRAALLDWLAALPWQGDMIMLHLGN